jgi:hypothetical protein
METKGAVTAFIARSFATEDGAVFETVAEVIRGAGVSVSTGESPEALTIASKVRGRIDGSDLFVALMTHRHRVEEKKLWTTSPWVIEEKGYALAQNPGRPIILLVEEGIPVPSETGGLAGDMEVIFFTRERFTLAATKLRQMLAALKLSRPPANPDGRADA